MNKEKLPDGRKEVESKSFNRDESREILENKISSEENSKEQNDN